MFNGHSHSYKVGYQYYRKCNSNTASSSLYKAPKESMLGRKLMMNLLSVANYYGLKGSCCECIDGSGKYGVYFLCDK